MRRSRSPSTPGTTADGIRTWVWGVWSSWGPVASDQQASLIKASSLDSLARMPGLLHPLRPPGHRPLGALYVRSVHRSGFVRSTGLRGRTTSRRRLRPSSWSRFVVVLSSWSVASSLGVHLASPSGGFQLLLPVLPRIVSSNQRPMSTVWGVVLLSDTAPVPPVWWGESLRLGRVTFQSGASFKGDLGRSEPGHNRGGETQRNPDRKDSHRVPR